VELVRSDAQAAEVGARDIDGYVPSLWPIQGVGDGVQTVACAHIHYAGASTTCQSLSDQTISAVRSELRVSKEAAINTEQALLQA
jgi:hypothetical protein